jgi:archaellum component FlaG (FlaF/FlaG flagellin family)
MEKTNVLKNETAINNLAVDFANASTSRADALKKAIALLSKGDQIERKLDAKSSDYAFWQALKNACKIVNSGKTTAKKLADKVAELNDPNKIRKELTTVGQEIGVIAKRETIRKTEVAQEEQPKAVDLMSLTDEELTTLKEKIQGILDLRKKANDKATAVLNKTTTRKVA